MDTTATQPARAGRSAPTARPLAAAAIGLLAGLQTPLAPAVAAETAVRPIFEQDLDCLAEAHVRVKVSAAVSGLVDRILVDRGDRIAKGQVLAELESSIERAQLEVARSRARNTQPIEAARAKLEHAQAAAARLERLRQASPGSLTATQYDEAITGAKVAAFALRDAELTLEAARLEERRAEAMVAQRVVRSPIDGIVVERTMSAGEHRNEQSSIMTVAGIDPLHVEVFPPIALYGQIAVGHTAEVAFDEPIGARRRATVAVVDKVLDAASGTFGIRLIMPNPDPAIPGGVRCRIRFDRPRP